MPDMQLKAPITPWLSGRTLRLAPSGSLREETAQPWAGVLAHFYHRLVLPLPPIWRLRAEELPAPYRQLLAHNHDMTPTLEQFHGDRLALRVCSREHRPGRYLREVVLSLARRGRPAEYGAICIYLSHFSEEVRERILAEEHPLGRILQTEAIPHLGWPQAFFRITPDTRMRGLLDLAKTEPLYGRRNVLLDGRRRLLADVIEILAPRPD
jgi:chorismate-pyruvate lyase